MMVSKVWRTPEDVTQGGVVIRGDTLERITRKLGLQVNWRFIQRINGIEKAHLIQRGQRLKVLTGTFHAVVLYCHITCN